MKNRGRISSLRKFRSVVEAFFLLGPSILLLGAGREHFGWMAKLQFIPTVSRVIAEATLLNLAVLLFLLALALLFGRIYCSTICPLGAFQDVLVRVETFVDRHILKPVCRKWGFHTSRTAGPFRFRPERKGLRYGVLAIYAVCFTAAFQPVIALLAPYSCYGRILHSFYPLTSVVGIVSFVVIVILTCLGGRLWCNLFCPVGTLLGLISKKAALKIRIDEGKCVSCGLCGMRCKASCIDTKNHKIDSSRCVVCFDCIDNCHSGAISFGRAVADSGGVEMCKTRGGEPDNGRREFLATTAVLTASTLLPEALSAADEERPARKSPERKSVIVPPGAQSINHIYERCTACQLCVSACPNKVLKPSTDLTHLMVPQMDFSKGWCRPECNTCSTVCPSGAILPLEKGEKMGISIGVASIDRQRCVVNSDGVACGNCARHCPSGALKMIKVDGYKRRQPVVDESLCIGCGACEYLCPARPHPAIAVNGRTVHLRLD